MIVLDTSALVAIIENEPEADACAQRLKDETKILISAGTLTETFIISAARNYTLAMAQLIERIGVEVVPVTAVTARRIGDVYARWGKAIHPAGLNFGDCFAYELAESRACPLLYIGNDFSRTAILRA